MDPLSLTLTKCSFEKEGKNYNEKKKETVTARKKERHSLPLSILLVRITSAHTLQTELWGKEKKKKKKKIDKLQTSKNLKQLMPLLRRTLKGFWEW